MKSLFHKLRKHAAFIISVLLLKILSKGSIVERSLIIVTLLTLVPLSTSAEAQSGEKISEETQHEYVQGVEANKSVPRIITLAPHLTEWVYSLGLEAHLIGVSDYSNFPKEAQLLPKVADYQGADLSKIMALQPTLILAWEGGNKPQDLHRLESLGYKVFRAKITEIEDIASELMRLAKVTNTEEKANALTSEFLHHLAALRAEYATPSNNKVFYYSWTSPLMTIGDNAWPNKLLNVCGAQTLFADSPVDYPQVSVQEVLSRQPFALVAASNQPTSDLEQFWRPHRRFLSAPLIVVNPDITSRFSLRLINELKTLCKGIN